jgi:hypothetical protein
MREDHVFSMAVRTIRRFWILQKIGFPVFALKIIFCDLGMAVGTVHTARGFARAVPLRIDVGVTLHTGNVSVLGVLDVFFVNSHGNFLSLGCFHHIFFLMAFEALAVRCPEHKTRPSDRMRLMAVRAGRNSARLLFPELSLDDFNMDFFDTGMALCAGCGDVAG